MENSSAPAPVDPALLPEIARRRTFAIVSHPDAGKTTLTEKFLLYGGAVHLAGSVTARRNQRATTSDWMELEKKRGISISSTVLQFDYHGFRVNLLDTPGHSDFSEDTYRVLTAVDAAVMVIDAAKGIENQTRKLFEVCRQRGVPIFTFINKLDRPSREPLDLLDELEDVLGIAAYPMNWPLGTGLDFRGVWDRRTRMAHIYEPTAHGIHRAPVTNVELSDPVIRDLLSEAAYEALLEEVELLDGAGTHFDAAAVATGRQTPVYFGSALNNFGVQPLLDGFLEHSCAPGPRRSGAVLVQPHQDAFTGFVFKIQANMDPRHRDRIAFVRVVSGKFTRDMTVTVSRTGERTRLSNSAKVFGRDRETVDEAYPGDVVGIVGNSRFVIGDTLTEDPSIRFDEIPRFTPECFSYLENTDTATFKRFRDGMDQLLQEGVVQRFERPDASRQRQLIGAVGPLQFEIVQYRLESEYGAAPRVSPAPWTVARWVEPAAAAPALQLPRDCCLVRDDHGRPVALFDSEWSFRFFRDRNPEVSLGGPPFRHGEPADYHENR
ncbi:MAG: peptide chain release factor 3 [Krumholzibacteria bacterium]|nr:peptide chain release factor 3 [Candidatus Krumholzibacteria bacterium]